MNDLNEIKRNLIATLGEDLKKQYFGLLKEWFTYSQNFTKLQFDSAARKLLTTEEQLALHNQFVLGILAKAGSSRVTRNTADQGNFEMADFTDYMAPSSPTIAVSSHVMDRSAASEFFLPDSGFISTKICIHVWEQGLDGAEDQVADYLVQACQAFVKNILTAMISKKESYKIRDRNFQYGFGFPVPDPLIRNSNNVLDYTQESKVNVMDDEDNFIPAYRPTLESIEQQTAFAYACGKRNYSGDKLTVKLLYETLRENPHIVGLHSINSTNLLKIGLQLED